MCWLVLYLDDSRNAQTISEIVHQLMNTRGKFLENYGHADGFKKLNTSTKAVIVTQLSDTLIIQLNILKYIAGINEKIISNLSVDEEISLWGNTMLLSSIMYHKGEQS